MALFSWLRALHNNLVSPQPNRPRKIRAMRRKAPSARLRLEELEDRTVPSAVSWVGGSGDWETVSNWSSGALPGPNDDVTINVTSITVTHTSGNTENIHSLTTGGTDTLSWSAGSLNISHASTLSGAVNLSGGTWTGGGNLTLSALLTWTGGIMTGSGTTTANGGITLNGTSTTEFLDGRTLNNANSQTAAWSGTNNNIYLEDGAVFNNQAGSTFSISNDQNIYNSGVIGTFKNSGTLTKSTTTGTTNLYAIFNNPSTVNVNSGTVSLNDGGGDAGSFSIASGATLSFSGGVSQLGSSSTVSGAGTVDFAAGTTDMPRNVQHNQHHHRQRRHRELHRHAHQPGQHAQHQLRNG
jgi:hypothetical protein